MITVNGEAHPWHDNLGLADLVAERSLEITRVAIELNGVVVARTAIPTTPVPDDARVEIVHFVGGG